MEFVDGSAAEAAEAAAVVAEDDGVGIRNGDRVADRVEDVE